MAKTSATTSTANRNRRQNAIKINLDGWEYFSQLSGFEGIFHKFSDIILGFLGENRAIYAPMRPKAKSDWGYRKRFILYGDTLGLRDEKSKTFLAIIAQ